MNTNLRKFLPGAVLVLGAAVPLVLAVEATHQPACDRGCLIEFTGSYLNAMLAHNPSALKVAPGTKITENSARLWKTAKSIPSRHAFADPTTGEAGFFGTVIEEDGTRANLALHLKIHRQQIEEVEAQVSPAPAR